MKVRDERLAKERARNEVKDTNASASGIRGKAEIRGVWRKGRGRIFLVFACPVRGGVITMHSWFIRYILS